MDIGARLQWQRAAAIQPGADSSWTRVMSCGGEAEISKLRPKFPQKLRRLLNRGERIE
jgi:hypothetical protein